MFNRVCIASVASELPPQTITSAQLRSKILKQSSNILFPPGIIEMLTGVKERRVLADSLNASDLATEAGKKALKKSGLSTKQIECMMFASASSDITEPATANIIQQNLGLTCPVFDIKNACNSFMNAIETAEALIKTGKYNTILITNGEVTSRAVKTTVHGREELRRAFAGYTLGDAGTAMVLTRSENDRGIICSTYQSYGEHWQKSTILAGGSRYPRDLEKSYFEGETAGLKDIFLTIGPGQILATIKQAGWNIDEIDLIVPHQVSANTFDLLAKTAQLPKEKMMIVLPELGNMASASIPVALTQAEKEGRIKQGSKVLLIGLAAGVSIATMAVIW